MNRTHYNRTQYLAWLRRDFPALYRDVMPMPDVESVTENPNFSLSGFWDSVGTTFNSVVSTVTDALPKIADTYSQYEQKRAEIALNTQRAQAGQAPVKYENGRLVTQSGLPYTSDEAALAARGMSTQTMLLLGGFGALALILLTRK